MIITVMLFEILYVILNLLSLFLLTYEGTMSI